MLKRFPTLITLFVVVNFLSLSSFAAALPSTPDLIKKGEASYKVNCAICHGDKGDGNGPAGVALKPKPRNFKTDSFKGADGKGTIANPTKEQIYDVLQNGVKGTTMTAYKHLPEDQKWGLVYYLLNMRKK